MLLLVSVLLSASFERFGVSRVRDFKIASSQTNNRNAIFDQRSSRPLEVGVSRWRTQTYGYGDLLTNSAQWGRVGENNAVLLVLVFRRLVFDQNPPVQPFSESRGGTVSITEEEKNGNS